jgi:hypothetical protein
MINLRTDFLYERVGKCHNTLTLDNCWNYYHNTSKVYWRWFITFLYLVYLDIIHRPSFKIKFTTFQRLALSPSSGDKGKGKREVMREVTGMSILICINYNEPHTLVSMVTYLPLLLWLNSGSNHVTHCYPSMIWLLWYSNSTLDSPLLTGAVIASTSEVWPSANLERLKLWDLNILTSRSRSVVWPPCWI